MGASSSSFRRSARRLARRFVVVAFWVVVFSSLLLFVFFGRSSCCFMIDVRAAVGERRQTKSCRAILLCDSSGAIAATLCKPMRRCADGQPMLHTDKCRAMRAALLLTCGSQLRAAHLPVRTTGYRSDAQSRATPPGVPGRGLKQEQPKPIASVSTHTSLAESFAFQGREQRG